MREPQSNRQHAPTYTAGSEAKEETDNSISVMEPELEARGWKEQDSEQATCNYHGKRKWQQEYCNCFKRTQSSI